MTELCQTLRVREGDSVAVGPQDREYICGEVDGYLATEELIIDGEPVRMCARCAEEARDSDRYDTQDLLTNNATAASKLRDAANYLQMLAVALADRPSVAGWLGECSVQLEALATDIVEGKL